MSETRVIRQLGSGRCHVARLTDSDLVEGTVFGSTGMFVGLDPVAAVCGVQLRGSRGPVVVMTHAKVDCRVCARFSGVAEVSEGLVAP